jgi:hypothetical protein
MNQNLISVALLGIIGFSAYKIYEITISKRIGQACSFSDGPDGKIVYTFENRISIPTFKCRRCNLTGCASYPIDSNKTKIYGKK